jgi:hypothetical protein
MKRVEPLWVKLMVFHGRWRSRAIYTENAVGRWFYRITYAVTFRLIEWITLRLQARAWRAEKETSRARPMPSNPSPRKEPTPID